MRWRPDKSYGVYLGDLDRCRTDSQGIISHALALTRAVGGALRSDERLVVICSTAVRAELGELRSEGHVDVIGVETRSTAAGRLWREQVTISDLFARADVAVAHFPKGRLPLWWRGSSKVIASVHDDIPMQYHAGTFGPRTRSLKSSYVVTALKRTLRTADLVLTLSDFSRRQLELLAESRTNIRVVVPGLGIDSKVTGAIPRRRAPRLLVFDSRFAHKQSVEAATFSVRALGDRGLGDHQVLLLGSGDAARLQQSYPDRISRQPGPISTEQLRELVRTSRAVVVASRYEGLGMTPLEAWAEGTPAVVADSEAARSALLGAPGMYRRGEYSSFSVALDEVLAMDQLECDVWAKVMHDAYDWRRAGEETLDAYREIAR